MYIVLLDHSGSMGDGFAQADTSSRTAKHIDAEVKLDAARVALLQTLERRAKQEPNLPAVRNWIRLLRDDPEFAQKNFDHFARGQAAKRQRDNAVSAATA